MVIVACGAACGATPPRSLPPPRPYRVGGILVDGAPPLDPAVERALAPYARTTGSWLLDLAADGKTALVATGTQLHTVGAHVRDFGAWPGLTWAACVDNTCTQAFVDVDEGGEALRLYLVVGDGTRVIVSQEPGRQGSPGYDAASHTLAWTLVRPGADATELWALRQQAFQPATLLGAWTVVAVDPTWLWVRHDRGAMRGQLFRVHATTGEMTAASPDDNTDATTAAPIGQGIVALEAVGDDGHAAYAELPLPHAALPPIADRPAAPLDPVELDQVAVADGHVVLASNTAGASALWLQIGSDYPTPLANLPTGGVIADVHAREDAVAFTYSDPTHPRDVYRYGLRARMAVRLTTATDAIAAAGLVAPRRIDVQAADGVPVAAWVYRPPGPRRAPVVVELHGGPEEQWRPRYQPFEQFLVGRGYAIVQPDVRGSTGHGRGFAALDDGARRPGVLADVRAVLDWIAAQRDLDPARVVVMGTSYGGFLALATVTAMPDRVAGAIDMAGMVDLAAFLAGTAPYRRDERRAEYGDERDPAVHAVLDQLSPAKHVAALRRPVLVAHGRLDPRVPYADVEQFVRDARAAGATVWSVIADDEGHTFGKAANRGVFEVLAAQFLDAVTGAPRG